MAVSTISGVSSGIDWQATIDSLMQIERRRVTLLENRQTNQQQRLDAWRTLNTRLQAFQTKADQLSGLEGLLAFRAQSGNDSAVRVEADSAAAEGSYRILVDALATGSRIVHQGWADSNSTAVNSSGADQVFAYTYGSGAGQQTVELAVPDGTTLAGLRELINNDAANPGLRASLLNDGSGSATAWHLVLSATETGADREIAVDDGLTTLAGFDSASISDSQLGQNARFRIDGYPAGDWLESASNTVSGVLEGLTLTLLTASGSETLVTVSRDDTEIKSRITDFVEGYNDIVSQINLYSAYDAERRQLGLLFGDANLSRIESELARLTNRPMGGLPDGASLTMLAQAGITSGDKGLLSIDSERLDEIIEGDLAGLGQLFAFSSSTSDSHLSFFTRTREVAAGDYEVVAAYGADGSLLSATINGEAAGIDGSFIVGAQGTAAEGLRLLFADPGDGGGSVTATVRLGLGVAAAAAQLLGTITDGEDGLVQYQTGRIEESIDSFGRQIELQEARLEAVRQNLQRQFLTMESAIARLQAQAGALSSLTS
jgi:flagellar hook-associated protein 2